MDKESAMAYVHNLLRNVLKLKGSDLFVTAGAPPSAKINGSMKHLSGQPLSEDQSRMLVRSIMNDKQMRNFEEHMEGNFSISLPGSDRFRVNAFTQRGCSGMVLRHIPGEIPSFKELGVSESNLNRWLGGLLPVVRCMPNTPALVQAGMTGLYANARVSEEQRSLAENIMRAVGMVLWFDDEEKLHAITAVSGSGPAYFFLVMEAMQASAEGFGLTPQEARILVQQTAFGAAKLAMESPESAGELRRNVTSPGGTTEAAIGQLQAAGLEAIFDNALKAAAQRSIVLSGAKPAIEKS